MSTNSCNIGYCFVILHNDAYYWLWTRKTEKIMDKETKRISRTDKWRARVTPFEHNTALKGA